MLFISGYLQKRNEIWNVLSDKYPTGRKAPTYYKTTHQTLVTEKTIFENELVSFFEGCRKGHHFIGTPGHGKSYVTDFLCTSLSAEHNLICNKIMFYHMCSLNDINSSNSFFFIKQFSDSILSLNPDIGQQMYLDPNVLVFFQEEFCLHDMTACTESLLLTPMKKLSTKYPGRRYIILMDFLDDCLVSGKDMNIIQILRTLIKDLPEQFRFLFISRQQKFEFSELDFLIEFCVQGMFQTMYYYMNWSCKTSA